MESKDPPIFDHIDRMGPADVSSENKARIVTELEPVLNELGVDPDLARDVSEKTRYLQPLLSLTFQRKPKKAESITTEGRGVYHNNIPIGEKLCTAYIKGCGSEQLIDETKRAIYPAFPSDTGKLMFDSVMSFSDHPRIMGTETLSWGSLEFIDACVVFSEIVKENGWKTLEQAIDAGVTIPIGVVHFKELSNHLQRLVKKRIDGTPYQNEKNQLEWEGNAIGLGAVGLITPSDTRLPTTFDVDNDMLRITEDEKKELKNPKNWKISGHTLRKLLKLGVVYSYESSHGQNMYNSGELAQADNSDLVFLGDYKDTDVDDFILGKTFLSATEQRQTAVYRMLERNRGLTPPAFPMTELSISGNEYMLSQSAFWEEFLDGVAHEDAIKNLPEIIPVLRLQINLAASKLLVEKIGTDAWNELAEKRKNILSKFDTFGAENELNNKIMTNLPSGSVILHREMQTNDFFGVSSMVEFMETGDYEILRGDPNIAPYIKLSEAIFNIEDQDSRDHLLESIGRLQITRDFSRLAEGWELRDAIVEFKGEHMGLLTDLINEGKYKDAGLIMDILRITNSWGEYFANPKSPLGVENLRHYYQHSLLTKDVNIEEFYEQVNYYDTLSQYLHWILPNVLELNVMGETAGKYNAYKYARDNNFKNPKMIISSLINTIVDDPDQRYETTRYMRKFTEIMMSLKTDDSGLDVNEGLQRLEELTDGLTIAYPEFRFAHNMSIASLLARKGDERAEKYYQDATMYYKEHYRERYDELGMGQMLSYADKINRIHEYNHAVKSVKGKYKDYELVAHEYKTLE